MNLVTNKLWLMGHTYVTCLCVDFTVMEPTLCSVFTCILDYDFNSVLCNLGDK